MWALIITVTLNLGSQRLLIAPDGNWFAMHQATFRMAVVPASGGFPSHAACEAYAAINPAPYLDVNGNFPLMVNGVQATVSAVDGCQKI